MPVGIETVLSPTAENLADVYAEALLEVIPEDAQAEPLAEELCQLAAAVAAVPGASELFAQTAVTPEKSVALVGRVFARRVSANLEALLATMASNGRLALLPAVARHFRTLLDRRQGRFEVHVTTAFRLNASDRQKLTDSLRDILGIEPLLRCHVDESVLGGVIIRVGDEVYDASVASDLKQLKSRLGRNGRTAPDSETKTTEQTHTPDHPEAPGDMSNGDRSA
jgi:F-type H+-transporting ATPase subunit delta